MSETWEGTQARMARRDILVERDIAKVKAMNGKIVPYDLTPEEARLVQAYRNTDKDGKQRYLRVLVAWDYLHREYSGPTLQVITGNSATKPTKRRRKAPELHLV